MAAPYSLDLRKRVLSHLAQHGSPTLTSQTFSISRSIIYDWKRLQATTGSLAPKSNYQQGHSHKVKNLERLANIVKENPGLTLRGIVKKSGITMSLMTCSRALSKLAITRKKNVWIQGA